MPLVSIQTSLTEIANIDSFLKELSSHLAALLGKPESYVMTLSKTSVSMTHGGSTEPACYVEVKSIGAINSKSTKEVSNMICTLLKIKTGIPASRVYIEFKDVPAERWGWNNTTFG